MQGILGHESEPERVWLHREKNLRATLLDEES